MQTFQANTKQLEQFVACAAEKRNHVVNIERKLVKKRLRQSSSTNVSVKSNDDAVVVSPYPKRGPRKNYKEDEVPDDDHYLCKFFFFLMSSMFFFLL